MSYYPNPSDPDVPDLCAYDPFEVEAGPGAPVAPDVPENAPGWNDVLALARQIEVLGNEGAHQQTLRGLDANLLAASYLDVAAAIKTLLVLRGRLDSELQEQVVTHGLNPDGLETLLDIGGHVLTYTRRNRTEPVPDFQTRMGEFADHVAARGSDTEVAAFKQAFRLEWTAKLQKLGPLFKLGGDLAAQAKALFVKSEDFPKLHVERKRS